MINNKLNTLFRELQSQTVNSQTYPGLLAGSAGVVLFEVLYKKHFENQIFDAELALKIKFLAHAAMSQTKNKTFCSGQAGVKWFFAYLYQQHLIGEKSFLAICPNDHSETSEIERLLFFNNYDFLHGGIGIAYYLQAVSHLKSMEPFKLIFSNLNRIMSENNQSIPHFDIKKNKLDTNKINIGLAHGIPSILRFCIECYKMDIFKPEAANLAHRLAEFLLKIVNEHGERSYFPTTVELDNPNNNYSRLAWCYGDLGVAYVLYQYGEIFKIQHVKDFAFNVLKESVNRTHLNQTLAYDAGVCHGTAGIAHIYNRVWQMTNNETFKVACEFWIEETIQKLKFHDGIGGYKAFDPIANKFIKNSSLLEGAAGVGLVLLGYITNDFSWDYCLMLNN